MLGCAILMGCSFDPGSFRSFGSDGAPGPDAPEGADSAPAPDVPPGAPDAAPVPDALRPPDAALPDAGWDLGPFGTAGLTMGLNTYDNEDDPTLRGDMLEIYFNSDRPGGSGGGDIWRATRASVFDSWSGVENVAGVNTASTETTPELTADGLTLYFASDRAGGAGGTDIYRATRGSLAAAFDTPLRVTELCSASNDFAAHEQPGGVLLYMGSNRAGGVGGLDVYRTFRVFVGTPWSSPSLLLEIDTTATDSDSWVDVLDTVIYFDSDRAGGMGGRDVWMATRGLTFGSPFGSITAVSELNTTSDDMDPWLSPDQRTIYFSTNRLVDEDIFVANR